VQDSVTVVYLPTSYRAKNMSLRGTPRQTWQDAQGYISFWNKQGTQKVCSCQPSVIYGRQRRKIKRLNTHCPPPLWSTDCVLALQAVSTQFWLPSERHRGTWTAQYRAINTHASLSGSSHPDYGFRVFFSPAEQVLDFYLKTGHDRPLTLPFPIHHPHRATVQRNITYEIGEAKVQNQE